MFKNRSFLIKPVKDQDFGVNLNGSTDESTDPYEGVRVAAAYSDVAKDLITHAAVTIGVTFALCKIVDRLCR